VIDANPTNFQAEVIEASHDLPVLVEFWAPWCAPCQVLGPILEGLEREARGAFKLVKVDADDHPALMSTHGVRALPTVVAFRAGQPVDRFAGARPEGEVRAFIARQSPRPGEDLLAQARHLLAAADWPRAAGVLRTVLALNPALDAVRATYVRVLLRQGLAAQARLAFEPLRARAGARPPLAALALAIDAGLAAARLPDEAPLAAAVAAAPTDPAALWVLAQWRIAHGRWPGALDALLALVRLDRRFADDAGRRAMLAVFELCEDESLVRDYRRRLAAALS